MTREQIREVARYLAIRGGDGQGGRIESALLSVWNEAVGECEKINARLADPITDTIDYGRAYKAVRALRLEE